MIYVYYADSGEKHIKQAKKLIDLLITKKPESTLIKIQPELFSNEKLNELLSSNALFEKKLIIFGNKIFEHEEIRRFSEGRLSDMAQSDHIFILVEKSLPVVFLKSLKKHTEKFIEASSFENKKKNSLFDLTDAVGKRDSKNAWMILQKEYMSGTKAGDIYPLIWWQIKNMLLAKQLGRAGEGEIGKIGIKPYPYKKAQGAVKFYPENLLEKKATDLLQIQNSARSGKMSLELGLEKFILSLST